jgi:hypothetical protein
MKINLSWKKPLFYLLLPVFFIMVFLGFPYARGTTAQNKGEAGTSHSRAGRK